MNRSEQEVSEYSAENALQEYESMDFASFSESKKKKVVNTLRTELNFLRNYYPDSYVLQLDLPEGF